MHRTTFRTALVPAALGLLLLLPGLAAGQDRDADQELPEGFEQILPRGRIASIDAPAWVSAETAEMPDEAIVLGVVIEGQPRAFSINLLNSHEVVNDAIGDTAYAAVW